MKDVIVPSSSFFSIYTENVFLLPGRLFYSYLLYSITLQMQNIIVPKKLFHRIHDFDSYTYFFISLVLLDRSCKIILSITWPSYLTFLCHCSESRHKGLEKAGMCRKGEARIVTQAPKAGLGCNTAFTIFGFHIYLNAKE